MAEKLLATQGHRQWLLAEDEWPMQWPLGVAGELAKSIYCASYLPQQEVSILATLALLSGVTGRVYRTPTNATLSQYYLLVSKTGTGKDELHKHIPPLIRYSKMPAADRFIMQERFVSRQALHKRLLESPGFLAMHPEVGKRFATIASPRTQGGPDHEFGNMLTEAYEKQFLEGITRAKAEDSFSGVEWPALSFVGDTTPGALYRALTPEMMEDGFFSRFLTMTVTTDRPQSNKEGILYLDPPTRRAWVSLVGQSLTLDRAQPLQPITVEYGPSTEERFDEFEEKCRQKVIAANRDDDITGAAVWNRAHIKALKVASLLAVADNCQQPKINLANTVWAIGLVQRDARTFLDRVEAGDVGDGDDVRQKKVLEICKRVIIGELKGGLPDHNPQVIPRRVIQLNTCKLAPFKNHRDGATRAMEAAIKSLVDDGYLWEKDKIKAAEEFSYQGRCFQLLRVE
ncbi:DUF3987 domain-containing protein [Microbulbifer celer]|uniref:DUF3987 domain-containing protein n=1 Tax=Microbulbifer celer TaxID=435905 RepID=A0ABW3UC90_9GAMM|nr:DUF3987 domain-containing protein [Microbulbifer celer]UFN57364.1 DUF3987 domain-containing protein [Microbulbifer celer]